MAEQRALKLVSRAVEKNFSAQEMKFAVSWLEAYGYLGKLANWRNITLGDIVDAIKLWQGWYGLKKTGQLTTQGLRMMMNTRRCGFPDVLRPDNPEHVQFITARAKAKELTKWGRNTLTYFVDAYVPDIQQAKQLQILQQAFDAWTQHCNLTITRASSSKNANIIVSTGSGRRSNFDGPGGTLAWAYLPDGLDSQLLMRFDLGEKWSTSAADPTGIVMFNVACHEFGHLLGLEHSKKRGALMAPYYNPMVAVPQADDDIPRIISRYGKRQGSNGDSATVPAARQKIIIEGYDLQVTRA